MVTQSYEFISSLNVVADVCIVSVSYTYDNIYVKGISCMATDEALSTQEINAIYVRLFSSKCNKLFKPILLAEIVPLPLSV